MRLRADQGQEQRINTMLEKVKPARGTGKTRKQPEVDLFGGGAA